MQKALLNNLIQIRRQIHSNPELGYQEYATASLVCSELDALEIPYQRDIAKTGVVAELQKGRGPCIALRADMDALPLKENTSLPFKSAKQAKNYQGETVSVMHACGHDLHTTILLGAAHLLKVIDFEGTIKFLFQPSEEGINGGPNAKSGGENFVDMGFLDDVNAALGLHVHPLIPIGKIAFKTGLALAATNFFEIEIIGKSAHAGVSPEEGIDAIYIAGQLITAIQSLVSRYSSPMEPKVISLTGIRGGTAPNIIANRVVLEGTMRAFDEQTYNKMISKLQDIVKGFELCFGAKIKVSYPLNYPALKNDTEIHKKLQHVLEETFGKENVLPVGQLLGGEDFAFIAKKVPSFFYYLGARDTGSEAFNIHDERVIFNEDCIPLGAEFLAASAVELVRNFTP